MAFLLRSDAVGVLLTGDDALQLGAGDIRGCDSSFALNDIAFFASRIIAIIILSHFPMENVCFVVVVQTYTFLWPALFLHRGLQPATVRHHHPPPPGSLAGASGAG